MAGTLRKVQGISRSGSRGIFSGGNRATQNQSGTDSVSRSITRVASRTLMSILAIVRAFWREDTAKSVNHVALVPIDHVAIRRLHFRTIGRRPGTAAQNSPIPTRSAASAFVRVRAPFPNVAAEIAQA